MMGTCMLNILVVCIILLGDRTKACTILVEHIKDIIPKKIRRNGGPFTEKVFILEEVSYRIASEKLEYATA